MISNLSIKATVTWLTKAMMQKVSPYSKLTFGFLENFDLKSIKAVFIIESLFLPFDSKTVSCQNLQCSLRQVT